MTHAQAAVQVAPRHTELRELPLPEISPDAGLLRVLAAGICGSDVPYYADGSHGPRILGHENVGTIERIGELARERWGVAEGDLVALEEYLPCGFCVECRAGEYRSCAQTDTRAGALRYGWTPLAVDPGLWGGFSEFAYLHPRAVLHRVPPSVSPRLAAMALPLGNGFQWAHLDGHAGPGQTVVVLGPGQQGLACAVAAKAAGARAVIVAGLARDAHRLDVARALGADITVEADVASLEDAVREATAGAMADLVIDVSSGGAAVVNGALALVAKRGTLLLASYKQMPLDAFAVDTVIRRQITLRGARGHSFRAVETALAFIAQNTADLAAMATHTFGLGEVDRALRLAGGETADGAIHISITPWNGRSR